MNLFMPPTIICPRKRLPTLRARVWPTPRMSIHMVLHMKSARELLTTQCTFPHGTSRRFRRCRERVCQVFYLRVEESLMLIQICI
jgi:hypothetical protein